MCIGTKRCAVNTFGFYSVVVMLTTMKYSEVVKLHFNSEVTPVATDSLHVCSEVHRFVLTVLSFVFDHKLGPWLDWFCIWSRVETSSLVPCNIVGVATSDCTTL